MTAFVSTTTFVPIGIALLLGACSGILIGGVVNFYLHIARRADDGALYHKNLIQNFYTWLWPIHIGLLCASAILFALSAIRFEGYETVLAGWWFSALLVTLVWIDAKQLILPNLLCYVLMWSGLLINQRALFAEPHLALWGAAVGYTVMWLCARIYKGLTTREGMGHGDFKLCAALGAWLGLSALGELILLASLSGIVYGLGSNILKGGGLKSTIAFGPHLAFAAWVLLFYPKAVEQIISNLILA